MKLRKTIILVSTNFYLTDGKYSVSSMAVIWSMKDTILIRELIAALKYIQDVLSKYIRRFPLRELFSWVIFQDTFKVVENFWILWTIPLSSSKAAAMGFKIRNSFKSAKSSQGPLKKVFYVKHVPCIAYFLLKWTRKTCCCESYTVKSRTHPFLVFKGVSFSRLWIWSHSIKHRR